jgi:archaellum component FlaF (FlaF/FlaG flagellin family)
VTCQIQADVVCHQIANGKPCEAIQLQTTDCNGDHNSMSFFYFPTPCSQPENVCEDFGLLSNILPASIKCNDDDSNELAVIPSTVNPNATFQVQNMNATTLPLVITCLITNAALNAAQIVTIQQSKYDEKYEFAQDYGSLRRVACATKSCEREILYEIVIYNTGETNVTVSNITVFNNNAEIKVPLPEKQLLPDQFITLDLPSNVNACKMETYTTEVEVDAKELLGGNICRAQANSTTDILPDCMVNVNMKCTLDKQDGLDCSDLSKPTAQCICETCVDRLVFRYTAARCSEPKPGNKRLASCIDREQDNTTNAPDAHIVITAGDRMLFNGIVTEGGDIVLNDDGECIGDAIDVLLAPTPGGLGILQNIRLDTSCKYGSEITLLESYGALTLIGYTCLDGEENKCFVDVTYNFTADNVGDVDFLLSNFTLFAKNTKNNLIQDVNATDLFLPRGKQYDVIAKETLNICSSEEPFVATLQAVGSTKALSSSCLSEKQATVQLQTECNTPSDKPSDQPSNIPSDSPSSAPDEYPPSMTSYKSTRYKYKCMMSSKSKKSNSLASSKYGPTTSMMSFKRTASPTSLPSTNEVFDVPNGKGGKGYSHFPRESRA